MKTIIMGSDHAGFKLKEKLKAALTKNYDKIKIVDAGTKTEESADYPDYAVKVGENVAAGADFGVLVCGSGIGMSIAANKIPGIRAALCRDELDAEMARKHNNANIVCLGERRSSEDTALKIVEKFIETEFEGDKEEGKRHKNRVAKFAEIEAGFCGCNAKKIEKINDINLLAGSQNNKNTDGRVRADAVKIAPSILSADFGKLNEDVNTVQAYSDLIHVDIMDGHFVNDITIGQVVVKNIKSTKPLDVHLMIENPEKYVEAFAKAGAYNITFHAEAVPAGKRTDLIKKIKQLGCKASIAINPDKEIDFIKDLLDNVDMVLLMTVFPGAAGQKFIPDVAPRIALLRSLKPLLDIEVDGGINADTIKIAANAGANVFVAGSFIFSKSDRKKAIEELRRNATESMQ